MAYDIPNNSGSFLFGVLNYHSLESLKIVPKFLPDCNYLIAPSEGRMFPPKRKAKGWRVFSDEYNLRGHEKDIYFKFNPPFNAWQNPNWESLNWYSFSGYDPNGLYQYTYKQVSHLPFWSSIHPDLFRTRLTMIWMRRKGKDIADYYDIVNVGWNQRATYYEVMNTPFYDEID
eukprot:gene37792-51014_t